MKKLIIVLVISAALIFTAVVGYLLFQNQKLTNQLTQTSPSPTPKETVQKPQESPLSTPLSKAMTLLELQENIKASVNSSNTQAMTSYMTNTVQVILQATECCGEQTPDKAVAQASYEIGRAHV